MQDWIPLWKSFSFLFLFGIGLPSNSTHRSLTLKSIASLPRRSRFDFPAALARSCVLKLASACFMAWAFCQCLSIQPLLGCSLPVALRSLALPGSLVLRQLVPPPPSVRTNERTTDRCCLRLRNNLLVESDRRQWKRNLFWFPLIYIFIFVSVPDPKENI